MKEIIKVGIDLALKNNSFCIKSGNNYYFLLLTEEKKLVGEHKLDNIFIEGYLSSTILIDKTIEIIKKWLERFDIDELNLEGYSFSSLSSSTDKIHEFGGILKYMIFRHYKLNIFPPSTIKKKFSGKGNATKEEMFNSLPSSLKDSFNKLCSTLKLKVDKRGISDLVDSYAISTL